MKETKKSYMGKKEIEEAVGTEGMKKDIEFIKSSVQRIESTLKADYATKSDLNAVAKDVSILQNIAAMVQKILYGTLGTIVLAVLYALLAQVIRK